MRGINQKRDTEPEYILSCGGTYWGPRTGDWGLALAYCINSVPRRGPSPTFSSSWHWVHALQVGNPQGAANFLL